MKRVGLWIGVFVAAVILMAVVALRQSAAVAEKDAEQRLAMAKSLESMAATSEKNAQVLRESIGGNPEASPTAPPARPASRSAPSAEMALLMAKLSTFMATMSEELREYQAQYAKRVDALQLENVLTAKSLATPAGRAKSRATMRSFGSYVDEAVEFDRKRAVRMNDWLGQHMKDISTPAAREFRKGFDTGYAKHTARAADFYKVQREFVAAVSQVLDVVETAKGPVAVAADGQLLFADADALARFTQLMANVQALAVREEALQKEMVTSQEATTRNLRGLSKSMQK